MQSLHSEDPRPQPLAASIWNWDAIQRVLIVRLRSIGDTVLTTPALLALKRFLPQARVDILLEDWVAPVLDGFPHVDNVIRLERKSTSARARVARQLRANKYDVVYKFTITGDKLKGKGAVESGGEKRDFDIEGKRENKDK